MAFRSSNNRGGFSSSRGGRGSFSGGRRNFRDRRFQTREMHKIKCAKCGKDSEVPFKPTGDRPVFCRECFMKEKGSESREPR